LFHYIYIFPYKGSRLQQSWSEPRVVTFVILWRCLNGAIVHRWRHKFQGSLHWWRWHYDSSHSKSKQMIEKKIPNMKKSPYYIFIFLPTNNLFLISWRYSTNMRILGEIVKSMATMKKKGNSDVSLKTDKRSWYQEY